MSLPNNLPFTRYHGREGHWDASLTSIVIDCPRIYPSPHSRDVAGSRESATPLDLANLWAVAICVSTRQSHLPQRHSELPVGALALPLSLAMLLRTTFGGLVGNTRSARVELANSRRLTQTSSHWVWPNTAVLRGAVISGSHTDQDRSHPRSRTTQIRSLPSRGKRCTSTTSAQDLILMFRSPAIVARGGYTRMN